LGALSRGITDGKTVISEQDGESFYEKMTELGILSNKYQNDVKYYNDNPEIYGIPDSTVTVGKTKFKVEDLIESAGDSHKDAGVLWAEI
jgi:hypothetical protein